MYALVALIVALGGCYSIGNTTSSMTGTGAAVALDDREPSGAAVEAVAGAGGWYAGFGLSGRRLPRFDAETGRTTEHHAGGLDLLLRVSPLGVLANSHALERYLDFGAEAGAGFKIAKAPPYTVALDGDAWVGGWAELGLASTSGGYMARTGTIRTIDRTDPFLDEPLEITVGLAFRQRTKPVRSRAFFLTPD